MTEYGRVHTDGSRSGGQPLIKTQHCPNCEAQAAEIERLRVEAQAQFDRGYYDGCANPIVRYDALRDALQHCADAIASWAKKPEGADPWLLGALDNALEALEQNK